MDENSSMNTKQTLLGTPASTRIERKSWKIFLKDKKCFIQTPHLCSFVHVIILVLKFIPMTSMSGVVQLAFMKTAVVCDDIEIYTDTIGLVITLQLAQIEFEYFYSCSNMFHETFAPKHEFAWEEELTTCSCKK